MTLHRVTTIAASLFLFAYLADASAYHPWPRHPVDPGFRRPIDVVICLDTSNSMDHLIDSARSRLWDVVTQLSKVKPTPYLRVGLLTYGSPQVSSAERGWVVRQIDLTDDLDTLYSRLMSLHTNGGDEYVGWVLQDAVNTMNWSRDPSSLKIIFVAGNESAEQGSAMANFRGVAEQAKANGIAINAIYCGDEGQGRREGWFDVAAHGGGTYAAIDMTAGTVQVRTPYDDELIQLNSQLNTTYIPYGRMGDAGVLKMKEQDAAAERLGAQTAGSRAEAKASAVYQNAQWDLVDASAKPGFSADSLADKDLPSELQGMTAAQRQAHLDSVRARRDDVQQQIQKVGKKRSQFLQEQQGKSPNAGQGLDTAMREAIRRQAEQRGFQFDEK